MVTLEELLRYTAQVGKKTVFGNNRFTLFFFCFVTLEAFKLNGIDKQTVTTQSSFEKTLHLGTLFYSTMK